MYSFNTSVETEATLPTLPTSFLVIGLWQELVREDVGTKTAASGGRRHVHTGVNVLSMFTLPRG